MKMKWFESDIDDDCPFYRHCTKEEYEKLLHEIEMRRNDETRHHKLPCADEADRS